MNGYGKKHLATKSFLTVPLVLGLFAGVQVQADEQVEIGQLRQETLQTSVTENSGKDAQGVNGLTSEVQLTQTETVIETTSVDKAEMSTDIIQKSEEIVPTTAGETVKKSNAGFRKPDASSSNSLPTAPSIPVTSVEKNGDQMTIRYNGKIRPDESIKVAVWSDLRGQDDLRWYTTNNLGVAYVNLKNHRDYGLYHIHTYSDRSGKMTGLNASSVTVATPTAPAKTEVTADDKKAESKSVGQTASVKAIVAAKGNGFDVVVVNVPSHISSVQVPVWTEQGGQDDIKWYNARKLSNNTFGVFVDKVNHKSETGLYHIHAYGKNSLTNRNEGLLATRYNLSSGTPTTPAKTEVTADDKKAELKVLAINYQKEKGTVQVFLDSATEKNVTGIRVAAWSDQNQGNLKWYQVPVNASGQALITVDANNHKQASDTYTIHAYVDYVGGRARGFDLGKYILQSSSAAKTPAVSSNISGSASQGNYNVINGVVYLDAGHGGYDPGASYYGQSEKNLTLTMQNKVKARLEAEGYKVVLTRSNDQFVDLMDRSKAANRSNADIFISIHFNASTSAQVNGIETYYYQSFKEYPSAINKTFHDNGERLSRSNYLANVIQSATVSATGAANRGVLRRTFAVLRETTAPAVLLELGFLSNPTEAEKIRQNSYQDKLADGILKGIKSYYGRYA